MARPSSNRNLRALDGESLRRLALDYVGRFATSSGKLKSYLSRKLRERGWDGEAEPPLDDLVARFCELGYVDDRGFALARATSLGRRGYGARRIEEDLRYAGVGEEAAEAARADARDHALDAALAFARRRRIGPFATGEPDADARRRALGAMLRAGHAIDLARLVLAMPAEEEGGTER